MKDSMFKITVVIILFFILVLLLAQRILPTQTKRYVIDKQNRMHIFDTKTGRLWRLSIKKTSGYYYLSFVPYLNSDGSLTPTALKEKGEYEYFFDEPIFRLKRQHDEKYEKYLREDSFMRALEELETEKEDLNEKYLSNLFNATIQPGRLAGFFFSSYLN